MFALFFSLSGFLSRGIVATGRGYGIPKLWVWASLGSFCVSPGGGKKKKTKFWAVRGGEGSGRRGPGEEGERGVLKKVDCLLLFLLSF